MAAPVTKNESFSVAEDKTLDVKTANGLLVNDGALGEPLTVRSVTQPTNGQITFQPNGAFVYIPKANFNGVDSFTYVVANAAGETSIATATINVLPVNDNPVAKDLTFTTTEDATLTVPSATGVLAGATDPDGSAGSLKVDGVLLQPKGGSVSINADGSFSYVPDSNFSGVDSFTYKISDGQGGAASATVTVNVTPVNDPPVAVNDIYTTREDTKLESGAIFGGVLDNDFDPEKDPLTVSLQTGPSHGQLTLNSDGTFAYTPAKDYNGLDSFVYKVDDGNGGTATATVTLTVTPVNDAPVAVNDTYNVTQGGAFVVSVDKGILSNDTDVDNLRSDLTVLSNSQPANGTLTLARDGSFTYTPKAGFNGVDSFTYVVDDSRGGRATGTVVLNVGNNNPPGAPTVEITTDANNDGLINTTELGNATAVSVKVGLPAGAAVGNTVSVTDNAATPNTVTKVLTAADIAAGSVTFSGAFPAPAEGGTIQVTAIVKNATGDSPSASDSAKLDTTAPKAPTLDKVDDDVAPVTGDVPNGGTTNDNKPDLSGTGEPGSVVTVKDGPTVLGSATVGPDGKWTLPVTTPLAEGPHSLTVSAKDPAGNESPATAPRTFTVDTQAPGAPTVTITSDADNNGILSPSEQPNGIDVKVDLPADAKAGDIVTLTGPNGATTTKTLTAADITAKSVSFDNAFPVPAPGETATVKAVITDAAGNKSPEGQDSVTVAKTATGAPVVEITEDTNNDGFINKAELNGLVGVKVTLPANAAVGDTVKLSDNAATPNTFSKVLTAADIAAKSVSFDVPVPAEGATLTVTAVVTNTSGIDSPSASDSAKLDTTAPKAPTLDKVDDDVAPVTGDVPNGGTTNDNKPDLSGTGEPGSVVTVKDGPTVLGSAVVGPDGKWSLPVTTPLAEGPHSLTVSAKDPAGNESPATAPRTFTVDTQAPGAPTVTITSDADNNGILSPSEQPNGIDVKVDLPADAKAGDIVTLTGPNGATTTKTLTAADITAKSVSFDNAFPVPAPGETATVKAVITDAAGNKSPEGQDSVTVAKTATGAPVVEITEDTNNDGFINKAELNGLVGVKVTLPANAAVGDTVKLSDNAATPNTFSKVLTAADIAAKSVSFDVPVPAEGATLTVTAVVTNTSGVDSPSASDSAKLDTTAPKAPTLDKVDDDVAPVTGDVPNGGTTNDNRPDLSGTGEPGSVVTVKDGPTVLGSATVGPDGKWTLPVTTPLAEGPHSLTVSAKDPAGNESPATAPRTFTVDTQAPGAPTVTITSDADNNGILSPSEQPNGIDVKVDLPADAKAGDIVTLTGPNGATATKTLTAADITAKSVSFDNAFPVPAPGETATVKAVITDAAGNKSPEGQDSVTVAKTATGAPVVEITEDTNNDGFINKAELNGLVGVKVTLPANAAVGDTVKLSDNAATPNTFSKVLTAADIAAKSVSFDVPVPAEGATLTVTAVVTNTSGIDSPSASDSAKLDTTAPKAPTLDKVDDDVAPVTGDVPNGGTTNDNKPDLSGTGEPGSVVTVKDGPTVLGSAVVGPDGKWSLPVTTPLAEGPHSLTVSAKDPAGNESPATAPRTFTVDTQAPGAPTVTITSDADNNGILSPSEQPNGIDVKVDLPADAKAGDIVTLTGPNGATTTKTLTAADITAKSVSFDNAFPVPAPGETATVKAVITDAAGNKSPEGQDSVTVAKTATGAPVVEITEDTNNDGFINKAELNGLVGVKVTLPANAAVGDTVKLSDNAATPNTFSKVLTAADIAAKSVSFDVPVPAEGATLTVTAVVTNTSGIDSPSASDSAKLDTTAPKAPTLDKVDDDVAPVTGDVPNGGTTNDNKPDLSGTGEPGSVVTVKDGPTVLGSAVVGPDGKWSLPVTTPLAEGPHSLTVSAKDPAGNESPATAPRTFTVDTQAPGAPTVTITSDADNNGILSPSEQPNGIDVKVDLPADAKAGDIVTLTGPNGATTTKTLTAADITAKSVSFDNAFPVPAPGETATVKAVITDAAGNKSPEGQDSVTVAKTATGAPVVEITEDTNNDGFINKAELNGLVGVKVTLPANAAVGDTVKLSDNAATPNTFSKVLTAADIAAKSVSFDVPVPAEGATLTVTAVVTNTSGIDSPSASDSAKLDTTAPKAPTLDKVDDDVAPVTGDVPNGGTTNDNKPDLSGTGEPGSVVTVKDGPTVLGSAVVGPDGKWTLPVTTPLAEGPHSLTVSAKDPAGNESPATAPRTFTVDTQAPGAPTVTITSDADNNGILSPSEQPNGIDVKVDLPADAKAGDIVTLTGPNGATTTKTLTAADITAKSVSFDNAFPVPAPGETATVKAVITDAAGNKSPEGQDSVTVAKTATGAPVVEITEDTNNDGFINKAELNGLVGVKVTLPANAAVGDTVKLSDNAATPNTFSKVLTAADIAAKSVSFDVPVPAEGATLTVTAVVTNTSGIDSPSASDSAKLDTTAPKAPTLDKVDDDVAPVTGDVPNGGTTNDNKPDLSGTGEPGSVVTVKDGPTVLGSAVVGPDGKWSLPVTTPLAEGPHSLTVSAKDPAGNESPATAPRTFTVDTQAPGAPTVTITSDADNNGILSPSEQPNGIDVKVDLPADAKAGDIVTLTGPNGATTTKTLTAADITAKSVSFDNAFPVPAPGETATVKAVITDAAGNKSPEGQDSVTVAKTATGAPVVEITEDTNNDGFINKAELNGLVGVKVTLPANAAVGDTVKLSDNAATPNTFSKVLTAADIAAKSVSFDVPVPAEGATLTVTAVVTNTSGIDSPSASDSAKLDTTAPKAPTLDKVDDDVAPVTGDVPNGGTTNDNKPDLSGTGEPGSVVTVKDGPTVLGSAVVGPDGKWTLPVTTPLAEGPHSLTVSAKDPAGNESPATAPRTFTVDTQAPGAPTVTITSDADNNGILSPSEQPNGIDVKVDLPADAKAGDIVTLTGPNGATTTKTLTAADITAKSVSFDNAFPVPAPGETATVKAVITDAAGNKSPEGQDSVTVAKTATGAPVVEITEDTNNDGFINKAELNGLVGVKVTLPANAAVGDTVKLSDNAATPNTFSKVLTAADIAAKSVSFDVPVPAEGATLTVTAVVTNTSGIDSPSASDSAKLDTTAPKAPTLDKVDDDVAPVTGDVPNGGTTNDNKPDLSGTGEPGSVVTVKDGPTVLGSAVVGPDGKWSLPVTTPLAEGPHSLTVSAKDPAGNESPATAPRTFTVDTKAPTGTTLDTVDDNVGAVKGEVPNGAITDDTTPTFGGKGEPGSVITVKDGSTVIGSTTVKPDGTWSLTPATPLAEGPHSITATPSDAAGNTGAPTPARTFVIDTKAPNAPTLDTVNDDVAPITGNVPNGGVTNDNKPDLSGTGEPGSVVTVKDGPTVLGSAVVGPDGKWTLPVTTPLAEGPHSLTVSAKDPAGNDSPASAPRDFIVDTKASGAPTVTITSDADNNGSLSPAEQSNGIDVKVGLPGDAKEGDTLTVTDQAGGKIERTLTASDIANKSVTFDNAFPVPPAGQTETVTAKITDKAGNVSPSASDSAVIEAKKTSATIGDFVWRDENGNGQQDAGEKGVGGVKVTLIGAGTDGKFGTGDDTSQSTVTDASGKYSFTVNTNGTYKAQIEIPKGFDLSPVNVGNDNTDSDFKLVNTTKDVDLIVNGSFEQQGTGFFDSIPGWKGDGDKVEIGSAKTYGVDRATGSQVLELDALITSPKSGGLWWDAFKGCWTSTPSATTGVYQDVQTEKGKTYQLSLDVAQRAYMLPETNTVEVWWQGQKIATIDPTSTSLKTYSFQVTGSGGKDRLEFKEQVGDDDSLGGIIDNVRLIAKAGTATSIAETDPFTVDVSKDNLTIDAGLIPATKANASIVGANGINEGDKASFTVQLDKAVTTDTYFTIRIDDGTAQRVDVASPNQFYWPTFMSSDPKGMYNKDYTVYGSNGAINPSDTLTVKVAAGQTTSEAFSVQAWKENVWAQGFLGGTQYVEGTETFKVAIADVKGSGGITADFNPKTVSIFDTTYYTVMSPIVIDLNGDGIKTTAIGQTQGKFDLYNDGKPVQSGWISAQDGFLAADKNGNGVIDNRAELFGGKKGEGFAQLAAFDSNKDGVVNSLDARFGELKIWQDANQNHKTDAGELKSLADAGVKELAVTYVDQHIEQNGNILGEHSLATLANGAKVDMVDVYFNSAHQARDEKGDDHGGKAKVDVPHLKDLVHDKDGMDDLLSQLPKPSNDKAGKDQACDTSKAPVCDGAPVASDSGKLDVSALGHLAKLHEDYNNNCN